MTIEDAPARDAHTTVIDNALRRVRTELIAATRKFPRFNSQHEGYAVLREEVDELWDDVKSNKTSNAREEAIQVAAMAVRFFLDT